MNLVRLGIGIALIGVTLSSPALARDVKVGVPEQKDDFIESLFSSKYLKSAGINLLPSQFLKEDEILSATIGGAVDVGFFALSAVDQIKLEQSPRLYTALTRAFFFKSGEEIFAVEDTAFGDAVLADLRRAKIFPLAFWNRGVSKIVAQMPITSPRDFQRLKVGEAAEKTEKIMSSPILVSLGAEPKRLAKGYSVSAAITEGVVAATVLDPKTRYDASSWDDLTGIEGQLYLTDFQPIVGILSASEGFWNSLSESEKQAWRLAVNEATQHSRHEIMTSERDIGRTAKVRLVAPSDQNRLKLIGSMVNYKDGLKVKEDLLTVEQAKMLVQNGEDSKKKK